MNSFPNDPRLGERFAALRWRDFDFDNDFVPLRGAAIVERAAAAAQALSALHIEIVGFRAATRAM